MGMHQGTHADVNRPPDDLLRHDTWMRRLARGLVGNDADGDDVAQEVMIAAAQHPPEARGSVQPWLRAVARNRAVNEARAARRRASREAASAPPEAPASPEELALRRELQRLLAEEIARLAEPYREIVMLRYFDGLSSSEIGARARLPAATVRTRLKTALDSLRAALDASADGRARWTASLAPLANSSPPAAPAAPLAASPAPSISSAPPPGAGRALRALFGGAALVATVATGWWATRAESDRGDARNDTEHAAQSTLAAAPNPDTAIPDRTAQGLTGALRRETTSAVAINGAGGQDDPRAATMPLPRLWGAVVAGGDPVIRGRVGARLGRTGGIAGAAVRVVGGIAGHAPMPATPLVVSLSGGRLQPRVQIARIGQAVLIRNDDPAGQPIRVRQGEATLLDRVLAPREAVPILAPAGDNEPVRFEAGGDSTGAAFVLRADNLFVAVTDPNGAFALGDVPAGRYTLEVWDDALGTRVVDVNVPMAQPLMVDFSEGTPLAPPCRIARSGADAGPIGAASRRAASSRPSGR